MIQRQIYKVPRENWTHEKYPANLAHLPLYNVSWPAELFTSNTYPLLSTLLSFIKLYFTLNLIIKLSILIEFYCMLTRLGLFYAKMFGDQVHCTFIFTFVEYLFLCFCSFYLFVWLVILGNAQVIRYQVFLSGINDLRTFVRFQGINTNNDPE